MSYFLGILFISLLVKVYGHIEYLVQISMEENLDTIKNEAKNFGLHYKKKIVSNVYLFEEVFEEPSSRSGNSASGVINDMKKYFGRKITEIEQRRYAKIRYRAVGEELWTSPNKNFHRWIIERQKSPSTENCWPYYGMGIQRAWSMGYTGKSVLVAVVDNGVEVDHPELVKNIVKNVSFSFVGTDSQDIYPQHFMDYVETMLETSHGTMVAGLIAGEHGNEHCSAGVAFDSKLSVLKVFQTSLSPNHWMFTGYSYSDEAIPEALAFKNDLIDIYSCSFNLDKKFNAHNVDMKIALQESGIAGRKGKGGIVIFSAGNNQPYSSIHDCNQEAFASSTLTITISSFGVNGTTPKFVKPCAAALAATYGEYVKFKGDKKLETTQQMNTCGNFIGTSASAAVASGIVALTLQANPALTRRDIQYLIVITSSLERVVDQRRVRRNGFGFQYDPYFGFGLMNATGMVVWASGWKTVPPQTDQIISEFLDIDSLSSNSVVKRGWYECSYEEKCIKFLEQVSVDASYETNLEHRLKIVVSSPLTTCSVVLSMKNTTSIVTKRVSRQWNFTTVHFWGEDPQGAWKVFIKYPPVGQDKSTDFFFHSKKITLILFGTVSNPYPPNFSTQENSAFQGKENTDSLDSEYTDNFYETFIESTDRGDYIHYLLIAIVLICYVSLIWFVCMYINPRIIRIVARRGLSQ